MARDTLCDVQDSSLGKSAPVTPSAQLRPPLKGFAVQGHCCRYVYTPATASLRWPQRQWQVCGPLLNKQKEEKRDFQSKRIPVTPRVTHTLEMSAAELGFRQFAVSISPLSEYLALDLIQRKEVKGPKKQNV